MSVLGNVSAVHGIAIANIAIKTTVLTIGGIFGLLALTGRWVLILAALPVVPGLLAASHHYHREHRGRGSPTDRRL